MFKLENSINIGKIELYKYYKEFNLFRAILISNNLDTYIIQLNENNLKIFNQFEKEIRKKIPYTLFINNPITNNNILKINIYKVKKKNNTKYINIDINKISDLIIENKNTYVNLVLFIDHIYRFKNNPKNLYYKIKIKEIEFIN